MICIGCPYPDTCSWFNKCTFRRKTVTGDEKPFLGAQSVENRYLTHTESGYDPIAHRDRLLVEAQAEITRLQSLLAQAEQGRALDRQVNQFLRDRLDTAEAESLALSARLATALSPTPKGENE